MSNEYKEWIQEQTFETLATDNYNVKLLLLAEQAKNKKLVEALESITNGDAGFNLCGHCDKYLPNLAQQALNEVNK